MPSSDRPASTLLLGFVPRMGLAAARSLHQRGVRVIVATLADEETPVTSRAIARFVSFTELANDPAAFGEALRSLWTSGTRATLERYLAG